MALFRFIAKNALVNISTETVMYKKNNKENNNIFVCFA